MKRTKIFQNTATKPPYNRNIFLIYIRVFFIGSFCHEICCSGSRICKNMPAGFRLGGGGAPSSLVQVDGPVHGLSAGGLQGASCQKQGAGEGVLHGHLPLLDLSIWVPNSFVIDCVCWVVWACLNVLCWQGPLLERSLSRVCVGGILLARGVVRTLLATGTVLESTAGTCLRIRSDIYH